MEIDFKCNLCGSFKAHDIPFRYAFKDRFLWLKECDDCGLRSIWPRPTEAEIVEMYATDYFTGSDPETHHMNVEYVELLNKGDYEAGAKEIEQYTKSGNILEIGCATGKFLYTLKKAGHQVKGIELSEFAVQYGKEHFGIEIINKPFDNQVLGREITANEFDVVLMGDVLEHLTDPTAAIQLVHTILKPGGVALIQVPGTLNLISSKLAFMIYRLTGSQKTMTIPPYHLTEFTAASIRKMCKLAGFSRINIKQEIKHPSSITLRGSLLENFIKKSIQYPNYYLTKWFGIPGDRIHIELFK